MPVLTREAVSGSSLPALQIKTQADLDAAVKTANTMKPAARALQLARLSAKAKTAGLKMPAPVTEADVLPAADPNIATPDGPDCETCAGSGVNAGQICGTCLGLGKAQNSEALDADEKPLPIEESKSGLIVHEVTVREARKVAERVYDVVLITEGPGNAGQRNWYTRESIQQLVASGLGEGLRAYADHPSKSEERDRPERSVRTLVGYYRKVQNRESNGRAQASAQLVVNAGDTFQWVEDMLDAAIAAREADGVPNLVGISVDGGGFGEDGTGPDGQPYTMVREFAVLASADIVTQPGAGGQVVRRLRESLTSLVASRPLPKENAMKVKATDLQTRVRDAVKQLREAAGHDPKDEAGKAAADSKMTAALTELDSLATADVEPVVQFKESTAGMVPIERFREVEKAATDATVKADTLERTILASRLVRESKQPEALHAQVIGTLVRDCTDEASMTALLAAKDAETEAIIKQVTESMRPLVEGNRLRTAAPVLADDGGRANAARMGLPLRPVAAA